MCFSKEVSLGAGILLTGIGAASLARTKSPAQLPFAAIPVLFGLQQISEGFVWASLEYLSFSSWHIPATRLFLIFAQVIWPFWIPLSVMLVEREKRFKKILLGFCGIGLLVSCYLGWRVFSFPFDSHITQYHIHYECGYQTDWVRYGSFLYLSVTMLPFFFSHVHRMWSMGVLSILSFAITVIFFSHHIISVWCFFAAVLSCDVFLLILQLPVGKGYRKLKEMQ